ncbi:Armadillo repeat-containing protein 3 and Serine/threonine-protein kinase CTR1 [Macleaya cordata]|uniref:Armadillo repeat-containing protein 3 and Serine/threonine-protein kinase CTR1 n=1 Tax=Macleaya cordata TaxID=56857 RepID=A0A200QYC2_MACCD|nr:Armadillo repeat-containing protein 3 and Serine/threonine-protein kinase CTR1 [Macleaya cordata]
MKQIYRNTIYDNQYNKVTINTGISQNPNCTNPIPLPSPSPPPFSTSSPSPVSPSTLSSSAPEASSSAASTSASSSSSSATSTASSSTSSSATTTTTTNKVVAATARYDYFTSEEEFQIQLALAISASDSEFRDDRDKNQILERQPDDSGRGKQDDAAESLSRRYWDYNVLGYDDKVVDGFYDIYGRSMDSASRGKMPSLADMQTNIGESGFEVVVVNRAIDPALEELDLVAHCLALDCPATDVSLLVQRLAELVTEHMGGSIRDDNIMLTMWMEITAQFRLSLHTNVLPIGSLNIGLSRHRALLFKVLADNVGVPCRLAKGSRYTGIDDAAVSIIKLDNEREFLVDLMSSPGTLIPADLLSIKDVSFNSYNPRLRRTLKLELANDSGLDLSRRETLDAEHLHRDAKGKSVVDNSPFVRKPSPEMIELEPSSSSAGNGSVPPTSIGESSISSSAVGTSSQCEGKNRDCEVGDGVNKENLNVMPCPLDSMEDPESILADLNAFRRRESRKTYNFQKRKKNLSLGPGRAPLPLIPKNRSTFNEVPQTKHYEFLEELFPTNGEAKDYNASLLASSSSIATSKKVYIQVPNVNVVDVSGVSSPASTSDGRVPLVVAIQFLGLIKDSSRLPSVHKDDIQLHEPRTY